MKARSLSGCWTCRLRRKKCDEEHPFCSNCTGLNLNCDGYGPRPVWLDNGELEKAQAAKIKRMVKQTCKRRSRGLPDPVILPEIATLETPLPIPPASLEKDSATESILHSEVNSPVLWELSHNKFSLGFKDEIVSPDSVTEAVTGFWESGFLPVTQDVYVPQGASFERQPVVSPSNESANDLQFFLELANECLDTESKSSVGIGRTLGDAAIVTETDFNVSLPTLSIEAANKTPSVNELASFFPSSNTSQVCLNHSGNEAALLMHYLDQAFYAQFPFYTSTKGGDRGWLLTFLTGDETIYHTTLAFSQRHRKEISPASELSLNKSFRASENIDYYSSALNQLQMRLGQAHTWDGSEKAIHSMKILACSIQFVFLEALGNSPGDWSFHLRAAEALIPSLVQADVGTLDPGFRDLNEKELKALLFLSPENKLAIELFLGAFIWLDIHTHASTRTRISSPSQHEALFERGDIQLQKLFGCENWAMLQIFKVSKLDTWKRECEEIRQLSVAELVRQGGKIEFDLKKGLAGISAQKTRRVRTSLTLTSEEKWLAITEAFALSALTYLHVVVSGAHPELPEIKDSVGRAVEALGSLYDQKLLERVVWPVCVTGCMVSEDKQNVFLRIVGVESHSKGVISTLPKAFEIIKNCWEERAGGSSECEWSSAMKGIEQYIILI